MITCLSLNEAYFGSNKLLDDCDKRFDKIIKLMDSQKDNPFYVKITKEIMTEINGIERNVEELFNCKKCLIEINESETVNAYTICNKNNLKILYDDIKKNKKLVDDTGFKLVDGNNHLIAISFNKELFHIDGINGHILTGVMLHEIGHTFFGGAGLNLAFRVAGIVKLVMGVYTIPVVLIDFTKITIYIVDYIRKNKYLYKIVYFLDAIDGAFRNTLQILNEMLSTINALNPEFYIKFINATLKQVLSLNIGLVGYRNEKFADNFASMFGYADAVIDFETLMNTKELSYLERKTKNTIFKYITDMQNSFITIMVSLFDPHPHSITRVKDQLKFLKAQTNSVTNPEIKKALQDDIKLCEKMTNEWADKAIKMNENERKVFTVATIKLFDCLGGDVRDKLPGFNTTDYKYKEFKKK